VLHYAINGYSIFLVHVSKEHSMGNTFSRHVNDAFMTVVVFH